MPEIVLEKTDKRAVAIAYGSKDISDTFPNDQPYSGAWDQQIVTLGSQFLIGRMPPIFSSRTSAVNLVNQESRMDSIRDWSEKKDPYTQVDLLDSEEDQTQILIFRIKTSLYIPYRERLASSLITLIKEAKEEDATSPGIAVGSLRSFYNFLRLHTNIKCPIVSLTPEDNIYASWRVGQKRVFSVHFLPSGDVRFVMFKPNDRHPERQIRISGITTTDILMETVTPYGVWGWLSA